MKMGASLFWGIILIIIGLSLIIKIIFNIDFPIIKILLAFIFIYIGLRILLGPTFKPFHKHKDMNGVVFGENNFEEIEDGKEYHVVFGKGVYDLRNFEIIGNKNVKISTVFGSSIILLKEGMPVKIEANAVFANAIMPDGSANSFGYAGYTSPAVAA